MSRFDPQINSTDRQRIDKAIAAIAERTGAHLSLVITRVSDRYSLYPLVWAGGGAILLAVGVALGFPDLDDRTTVFIELALLLALVLLFDWMPIRLAIVSSRVKQAHARQLAHREFAVHCAAGGSAQPHVLIFISLAEHYAEVIADHATHARAPGSVWHKIVDDLLAALKAGQLTDGALAAIEACGRLLESQGPSRD
jgi:putative membrane protein